MHKLTQKQLSWAPIRGPFATKNLERNTLGHRSRRGERYIWQKEDNALYFEQSAAKSLCPWYKGPNTPFLVSGRFAFKVPAFCLLVKTHAATARLHFL